MVRQSSLGCSLCRLDAGNQIVAASGKDRLKSPGVFVLDCKTKAHGLALLRNRSVYTFVIWSPSMSANGLATQAVVQLREERGDIPASPRPDNAASIDSAISALSVYIPAEAMALYLLVTTSKDAIVRTFSDDSLYFVYFLFVFGFSPGLFLLAYFVKLANTKAGLPTRSEFPWFRLFSSIIAFAVWGLCVPGNPFAATYPNAGGLFGIIATIVSIVLPSVEAIWYWYWEQKARAAAAAANNAVEAERSNGD
jgi:hypothetical protein